MTIETAPSARDEFIRRLDGLVTRRDRARLAALRHLLAQTERWGPDAYAVGVPLLPPGLHPADETHWLLVAGLYALWHQGRSTPSPRTGANFGASMRRFALESSAGAGLSEAVERRFSILLASDDERLVHHLRQAVGQLSSHGVEVDFECLLDDLRWWEHRDRYVQRRWARAFWAPITSRNEEDNTE